jgi:glycosyltransferase involved in cell wall biosynthesis
MKVLTLSDHYLPGYKAGGPVRSLANLIDKLGDEFHFKVITRDRDFGDVETYPGIVVCSWQPVSKAEVFYLTPQSLSLWALLRLIRATEKDVIYLNSFFSPVFTIKPLLLRRLGLIPKVPIILAPRGEFSLGALGLKSFKKNVFIIFSKLVGLYRGIIWQVSSEYEGKDIHRRFGDHAHIVVAPNLPPFIPQSKNQPSRCKKTVGCLKIVFLSRISRKKNLYGALKMLKGLEGKVKLNIYGPLEDMNYWAECQRIIGQLPRNIEVKYQGVVAHVQVFSVMMENDLFFLPTLGENFGHVILEAMAVGCPVLISDRTPWRGLKKKGVGWDLSLSKPELFQEVLRRCVDMDSTEHAKWSENAREYWMRVTKDDETVEMNRKLFLKISETWGKNNV